MSLMQKLGLTRDPIYLVDGSAFIYRGFYANRHLRRSDGFPTNSLLLVTRLMLKILREENPRYMLFCMDGKGRNFRHEIYESYKANRPPMPEELIIQIEPILTMIRALGIPVEVARGFEADDCMASLSSRFSPERPVILVSADKDLKQCLKENVMMWDPASKDEKIVTKADFETETGVPPESWPDVQALVGDSVDNIPGVPGVGLKTALQIFAVCPSLEDIKNHLDRLPVRLQTKLEPHLEEMFRWRRLTTLKTDAVPHLNLEDLKISSMHLEESKKIARKFELASIEKEILKIAEKSQDKENPPLRQAQLPIEAPLKALGKEKLPILTSPEELPSISGNIVAILKNDVNCKPEVAVKIASENRLAAFCWHGTLAQLCEWLKGSQAIIVPDLKELLRHMESFRNLAGKLPPAHFIDLGLAAYLLDPESGDYSWERISAIWRRETGNSEASDPELALEMGPGSLEKLGANGLEALYKTIEMPLVPVLAKMEQTGVTLDPAAFQEFLTEVNHKLQDLTRDIYETAGCEFNIRSARQLGEVLATRLGINSGKKTKTGQISTSEATLEKLAGSHPIINTVLEYRKLAKLQATYLEPLPRLMDSRDRVHTTFNQKATATGRISSSNPNLQNIPVRGEEGKRMRSCFVAPKDHLLIAADYSQIELRVLAHLSRDETLLDAFRKNEDIHAHTAALIFDKKPSEIQGDERRMAKTINFGLLYGMGARKLAQELKIPEKQAIEFIDRYFAGLGQLKKFYDSVLNRAVESGFVTTMAGRIRWVEGITSTNSQIASQARRQAVNAVIQGTAADIIKLAMINASNDPLLKSLNAKLVLQIHDELLLEAPSENAQKAAERLRTIMESIKPGNHRLDIPLSVDCGIGKNWAEAH